MVFLSKIVTKGGDKGKTSLGDGKRIFKSDVRIAAIGTVDEANSFIGLARQSVSGPVDELLASIQNDLFDVGADLCMPDLKEKALRVGDKHIKALETHIEHFNASLLPIRSFVLPGGSAASASMHVARTVVRRAERDVVALQIKTPINPLVTQYLNRLSDLLFILGRYLNDKGKNDNLWVPAGEIKE
ncbi:MAG: cob(I)yrinic acid a,c-diamide adenosyltransferase [Alphaproteobacteria bacterium]